VLSDQPEARFIAGHEVYVEGMTRPLVLRIAKPVEGGPGWWLAFEGRRDRASVETLRDRYLEAEVALDELRASGAALWDEVVGLTVHDVDGRELGRVDEVYRAGEAEVYVVRGGPLGDFDLPVVRDFIRTFDPPNGQLVIDASLLDLEPPREARRPGPRRRPRWSRHGAGSQAAPEPSSGPAPSGAAADSPTSAEPTAEG
jgi:ribosomal 30S subunit maturation factor RimM